MRGVINCYNILVINQCTKIRSYLAGHSLFSLKTKGIQVNIYQTAILSGQVTRRPKRIN